MLSLSYSATSTYGALLRPRPVGHYKSTVRWPALKCVSSSATDAEVRNMVVVKTKKELAHTNFAYCSNNDLRKFSSSHFAFVLVGDSIVLRLGRYDNNAIKDGQIALNSIQRKQSKVSNGDHVSVKGFVPSGKFNLVVLTLELEKKGNQSELDADVLAQHIREKFANQVLGIGQKISLDFQGKKYIFTVKQAMLEGEESAITFIPSFLTKETYIIFEANQNSGIKLINQRVTANSKLFEFDLEKHGVGGLSSEITDIFRRVFASRVFAPRVVNGLGIKHVKGILLYGPPGTGKTLLARQIGKFLLKGKEPKIVSGPEVLNKYVGETEKNVRDLFAEAEIDQKTKGDESELHVIIFDEIDAICKSRGSTSDGTGVQDNMVNQLLTKIDGLKSLNNVLLIGTTNRKDLLDDALLRPGRLEVHIEINLPDENGRLQILQIHTNEKFLAPDVDLSMLVARTKNYSGAELEGVVKSASSYALLRYMDDLTKNSDDMRYEVTMEDFLNALCEILPAFGASTDDLERCLLNGIVDCVVGHKYIYEGAMLLVEQVRVSKGSPLVTCLLEGPSGSGKSAMAARIGIHSDFPYVKIISAETMIGLSESGKLAQIVKIFEDAYRSQLSMIILDDIERLIEYVAIGPRFSNLILQTLLALLKRLPPKGKRLLVIGTTREAGFLESLQIHDVFAVTYHVPKLRQVDVKKILRDLNVFAGEDIDTAAEAMDDMPIKKIYTLIEMAAQVPITGGAESTSCGKAKININHFFDILRQFCVPGVTN